MRVHCDTCQTNFTELPDGARLSPDFRFTCRECCRPDSSMLEGMSTTEIMGTTLARRIARERQLLPRWKQRTAARVQKWRTANRVWTRVYKMLRRAGVQLTKSTAAEFIEKWTARIAALACSFCGTECEPDKVQFWRDPAGDPIDPLSYWPACGKCAARKRAEVRWQKAA